MVAAFQEDLTMRLLLLFLAGGCLGDKFAEVLSLVRSVNSVQL